ncbi:MAG: apolipoprotein N-acyltransferase [Planctomycetota bacterium]
MRSPFARLALGHALSAVMLALAFPHPGWWWLAWVALVPAGWVELETRNAKLETRADTAARRRFLATWLSRASPFLTIWLIWSLWWFSRTAWVRGVSFPGWFVIAVVEGLFFAAAFAWFGWLSRQTKWPAAMLLPACWVSVELLRVTQPFGGFGWFALGHTQGAWRVGQASGLGLELLGGELATSLVLAYFGGFVIDVARIKVATQFPGFRWMQAVVGGLILIVLASIGLSMSLHASGASRSVRVAALQPDHPNDNSVPWSAELEASRWLDVVRLTVEAAEAGDVDVIVWPESALPGAVNAAAREVAVPEEQAWWGYWGSRHYFRETMLVAEAAGLPIIACGPGVEGVVERQVPDGQGGMRTARFPAQRTNSAYHIDPVEGLVDGVNDEGVAVDRYDKQHLVVAGETIPLGETFPWWRKLIAETISPWGGDYTLDAGDSGVVFEVDVGGQDPVRIATPICYEIVSPGVVRDMVYGPTFGDTKRADLLTNLTNNGWYFGDSMRRQILQIATFRAIENRVPVVMSCNTGVSAVIDATGRIVAELPMGTEGVLVADVGLSDARTWYGWWGRWPWWALMWAMVAWSAWLIWRGRRTRAAGGS